MIKVSMIMGRVCLLFILLLPTASALMESRLRIFVSIAPQKFLVERIGGDRVEVITMVEPGYSPELYDPTPRQLIALAGSRLYFRICVPFENTWMQAIRSANKNLEIIDCSNEISYRKMDDQHEHGGARDSSGNNDPHIWTNPRNARLLALQIRDVLIREDPSASEFYGVNYRKLAAELDQLDDFIAASLAHTGKPYFIVSHDSWSYFAERYGLEQIPLESGNRELGPKGLVRLLAKARRYKLDTIFIQKQYRSAVVYALADELGAELVEVDPLAEDYIENLRTVTLQIAESVNR